MSQQLNPAKMSGLEILQAMAEGIFPHPSICQTMPMQCVDVSEGQIHFSVQADDRHLNPMGGVHGGFAATILDSVTGCATHSTLVAGESYGTVDLNVKMVRPIPKNTALKARGKVLNISKTVIISEGDICDADGKLYAHCTATCVITRLAK
ncbi:MULTISPECIES: PaaI family thioesterase [unclassified Moritella]|uniref:PaaI family thioesterase n=1 Tax=unclassified Moritella TaxID=2637987 RepID=UPI001BA8C5C2|nr:MULTISPECIES: PaaI family thioesterase [unclassified Moritella]QUM79705.1 PaaI family thioesterase [Moritella sp. 5]QUM83928.1 PaaI family thioesterase [Moritella sp. 28]